MKRARSVESMGGRRWKPYHLVLSIAALYLIFISFKFPRLLEIATSLTGNDLDDTDSFDRPLHSFALSAANLEHLNPKTPNPNPIKIKPLRYPYGRITTAGAENHSNNLTDLERMAHEAWTLGAKAWDDLEADADADGEGTPALATDLYNRTAAAAAVVLEASKSESCPTSVSVVNGKDESTTTGIDGETLTFLPCGLSAGSAITIIGKPREAHEEYVPQLANSGKGNDGLVLVSQFMVELQGLKAVVGEDPPRILHLNPRLRGDWSHTPVIEHNTCYRMQWGAAMRCNGLPSKDDEDTVDGFSKCEKWLRSDIKDSKESRTTSWLQRFIGRAKKPAMTWPFPFAEGRLFILTLRAGVEGYHVNVGGRHITSFPYRPGFTLEDATGLAIKGDVEIHSVYATSLPQSHPSFSLQRVLEMSEKWKAPSLPKKPIQLFIGVLSATNHFAERMAVRKTWMQASEIKSLNVVARFFVALNPRKEVNAVLKKEAEYFGDIVILPFMDRYELVVLKTIAICEYGVQNLTTAYIMKCDDDTFIRVNVVLNEIRGIAHKRSLYMGNLNLLHRPLRSGKWAVTYEEWPEEIYPTYANGPGYIISSDIARFIVFQHANQSLRLFKMEDVSMGMWVEQFNITTAVQYYHNWKFCQYGCMENYYTAHYQSPRQMICLWDKLARGRAHCCNFR